MTEYLLVPAAGVKGVVHRTPRQAPHDLCVFIASKSEITNTTREGEELKKMQILHASGARLEIVIH